MDKTKRYGLGDRIFCKSWEQLLTTGLILSSKGYGVNVIGHEDMMNDVLTITALPEEKNDQNSDTRVTIKEAAEELQNLAKAGISQEPCDTCGYEEGSIYCKEHCPYEAKIEQEPCEDAISRQAVCKIIDDIRDCVSVNGYWAFLERLKKLPSVNPTKTGHWIIKDGKEQGYDIGGVKTWYIQIMCSECGFIKTAIEGHTKQYHYCPNCGAKMIEPQERSGEE